MRLKVSASTDGQYLGEVVEVSSTAFGQMSRAQIQAFAREKYNFTPDSVLYGETSVRLVNPNYSVTLEVIPNG